MTLYHATSAKNIKGILSAGIKANRSGKISNNVRLNDSFVYAFDNIGDAENFIIYDNNENHYAIFAIETDGMEVVTDSEYESGAFAIICKKVKATLVFEKNTYDC